MDLGLVHRGQNGIIHLFGELQIPFCSCKPFASHALLSALLKALQGVREGHDNQPAREQQEMPSHSSAVRRERAADTCLQKPQNFIKLWWQEKYHWERYCCAELGQGSALRLYWGSWWIYTIARPLLSSSLAWESRCSTTELIPAFSSILGRPLSVVPFAELTSSPDSSRWHSTACVVSAAPYACLTLLQLQLLPAASCPITSSLADATTGARPLSYLKISKCHQWLWAPCQGVLLASHFWCCTVPERWQRCLCLCQWPPEACTKPGALYQT